MKVTFLILAILVLTSLADHKRFRHGSDDKNNDKKANSDDNSKDNTSSNSNSNQSNNNSTGSSTNTIVPTTPIVATPVATAPVATTPDATTPVATTPVATAPVATTPVATTPVAPSSSGSNTNTTSTTGQSSSNSNSNTNTTKVNNNSGSGSSSSNTKSSSTSSSGSTSSSTSSSGSSSGSGNSYIQQCLDAHNQERKAVGVGSVTWNSDLAAASLVWAKHLASVGSLSHSSGRVHIGENVADTTHHDGVDNTLHLIGLWIDEKKYFKNGKYPSISTSGNVHDVGHYSQMIWGATTEIGCATAVGSGHDFMCCQYKTSGNVQGQKVY